MKALVVVDYQADFVNGALGFAGAELLEPVILKKIEKCRAEGGQVIFTLDTHSENYLETAEGKKLPVVHCIEGTDGWQLDKKLQVLMTDSMKVFDKPTFGSVALAEYLKADRELQSVTLVGLCTDICVISNALLIKANMPEVTVQVIEKCCAGVTPQSHANALDAMRMCQIQIL